MREKLTTGPPSSEVDLVQLQTLPQPFASTSAPARPRAQRASQVNGAVGHRVTSLDLDMEQRNHKRTSSGLSQNSREVPAKARSRKPRRRDADRTGGPSDEHKPSSASDDGSDRSSGSGTTSEEAELGDGESDDEFPDEETGLTGKERRQRRRRDRKNSQLDARIAGKIGGAAYETKVADQTVLRRVLTNAVLIGLWYLFSLSISLVRQPDPHAP